jgi:hypothetical protein
MNEKIPKPPKVKAEKVQQALDPAAFAIPQAKNISAFNAALEQWKELAFSYWGRAIQTLNDEDAVIAWCGEALRKNNYRAAVASVSPAFLEGSRRGYESSAYLGSMDAALRSFVRNEKEKIDSISRMISGKSPDFILQTRVFEYLLTRAYTNIADEGLELVRQIDPATLNHGHYPGIFEGYVDIKQWRPHGDNPFERLVDHVCKDLLAKTCKDAERNLAFVFNDGAADIGYNIRVGKSLIEWGDLSGKSNWASLGRTLVLSALSLCDTAGAFPESVSVSESGKFLESGRRLNAAQAFRIIGQGEHYPRAAGIGSVLNGLWAWTAASKISASQENNVLDISVYFPEGETHYMMIRGVRPFTRIQLYDMDYRTDWQFERYDSSGWVYSAQEQVLTLKMKHRSPVEYVRIFY